jgi:outer membrane protein assembly factor BamB
VLWEKELGVVLQVGADERSIYVADEEGVEAFDTHTGDGRWTSRFEAYSIDVAADTVFLTTTDPRLVALDAATGAVRFRSDRDLDKFSWKIAGVTDHVVVLEGGHSVLAFSVTTGQLIWEYTPPAPTRTTVAVGTARVALTRFPNDAEVLDANTGTQVWSRSGIVMSLPSIAGDKVATITSTPVGVAVDTIP